MGWLDDFTTRMMQSNEVQQVQEEVGKMLAGRLTEEFVKIIDPPRGNLTPAEIAAGMTGEAPQAAIEPSTQYQTMMAGFQLPSVSPKMIAAAGAALIGLYLLVSKRGK